MPTNTPIPSLSTGNVLTAGNWDDLVPLNTSIGLFSVGPVITGTVPPTTAPNWYIQGGSSAVSTGGTGGFTVNFPTAFPNGLVTVFCCIGDNLSGASSQAAINTGGANKVGFVGTAWGPTGSTNASTTVRINWIAIGF